ncbi:hypothetical protein OOJ91_05260 [Micromonospora lupini]|uniref:hypothetical protein n=1 Tax=Micromonospora lupini TaxID=285679 RepID=UPI00224CE215|nr:hypothetical protein [Micromonospora lupini]MCX5065284.1 hypothetical protein [Micromonospora lupini]
MELERNWKPYAKGPALLVLAVVLVFSPEILSATGREFTFGNWVGYVMALLALIGGLGAVRESRQAFAVRIGAQGISWTRGEATVDFAWSDVSRVAVEKKPNAGKLEKPSILTVWVADQTERALSPDVELTGLRGYHVADLKSTKQSRDQVEAALRQYGGDRYPAPAN